MGETELRLHTLRRGGRETNSWIIIQGHNFATKLVWFGHMTRLPYNIPAKIALHHALKPTIRPRGQKKRHGYR